MTESEVLKIFENEVIILDCWIEHCKDIIADCETEEDEFDDDKERAELSLRDYTERKEAFDVAISAIKEVQQYREIGTVEQVRNQKHNLEMAYKIISDYEAIGTVEECREAVEKQKPKKCIIDSCSDHAHYKCPSCGQIELSIYKHGFPRLGRITKYCENCGQALIDENLEGME